jgi:hypothetical protein
MHARAHQDAVLNSSIKASFTRQQNMLLTTKCTSYFRIFSPVEFHMSPIYPAILKPTVWQYLKLLIRLSRSQWPSGLSRKSAAAGLLRLWVRIPPGACMSVCCECCVLSGRGLCDELILSPEEPYRLWCIILCDIKIS